MVPVKVEFTGEEYEQAEKAAADRGVSLADLCRKAVEDFAKRAKYIRKEGFLTRAQLAEALGVCPRTVGNYMADPENPIPHSIVRGRPRFRYTDVKAWVRSQDSAAKKAGRKA